jgi:hypothetical protein
LALDARILGIGALASYFGMDMLTTYIAICFFGIGAESNPAMLLAFNLYGLAGFVAIKLALSILLIVPSYALSLLPGTRPVGISALTAITTGGVLVAINNVSALATGASLFYGLFGDRSFASPGIIIAFTMLFIGALTYGVMSLRSGNVRDFFWKNLPGT